MTGELLTCLHCEYQWKPNKRSKGFPKQCPKCHSRNWGECQKLKHCIQDRNNIVISDKVYENLYRLKEYPSESFAGIVDRLMLNDDPSVTITYKNKQKIHSVNISTKSKDKLIKIKNEHLYKSHDEALWRVMNNAENRKL